MPRINPVHPNLYAAGAQGDGGVVSVNGSILLGPSAGGSDWFTEHEILCQYYPPGELPRVVAVHYQTREFRVVHDAGAYYQTGGGGHWAAVTVDQGVLVDGRPLKGVAPICYGPDG